MSEADVDKIIVRLAKKLFWMLVVPILVILIAAKAIDIRSQNRKAEGYYIELFRLTAELSTTQAMYMKANDEDKAELGKRIDYLVERMDKFTYNDTHRGTTDNGEKKYGLEFTPLL